jgi:hypothetical protein
MPGSPAGSSYAACGVFPIYMASPSGTGIFAAMVFPWQAGKIGGMEFNIATPGTGTANVVDVQVNGVSVFSATANRPTGAIATAGRLTQTQPNAKGLKYGDVITVVGVTNGSGAAGLSGGIALEKA